MTFKARDDDRTWTWQTDSEPEFLSFVSSAPRRIKVRDAQVITLDGCKLACATVNVSQAGGAAAREFTVLDCYRRNK